MNAKNLSVIVGLGDTGLACARYLQKRNQPFAIMDSRENPPQLNIFLQEFNGITYHVGGFCEKLLDQATEIILSPGVALKEPAIAKQRTNHKSIVGDIELFARDVKKPIVAITGSNGKTTVTTLVGLMVAQAGKKVAVCGNIGEPVLHALDHSAPDYYVVELSSFQLETTYSLQPTAATVLNITPDHMDRYVDLQDYTAAKQRIYHQCHRPVVNNDEPTIWQPLALTQPPIKFALHEIAGCDFYLGEDQQYLMHQGQALIAINELKLRAQHHLQNALAALSLGHAIDLPMSAMLTVLRDFSGLPHRCQWIRALRGVDYYDDSKGTNVGATEAALISLGKMTTGKIVLIAGGQGKDADFSSLKAPLQKYVSQLILIGEDAPLLEKTFQQVVPMTHASTMMDAVNKAAILAKSGDAVLLSPACASFDMFNNYKHRGEVFVKAVEAL